MECCLRHQCTQKALPRSRSSWRKLVSTSSTVLRESCNLWWDASSVGTIQKHCVGAGIIQVDIEIGSVKYLVFKAPRHGLQRWRSWAMREMGSMWISQDGACQPKLNTKKEPWVQCLKLFLQLNSLCMRMGLQHPWWPLLSQPVKQMLQARRSLP